MKTKLTAVGLVVATLALGGGTALVAQHPSPSRSAAAMTRKSTGPAPKPAVPTKIVGTAVPPTPMTPPVAVPPSGAATPSGPRGPAVQVSALTYTIRPGDTTATVARWFSAHGAGRLYAGDASVIDNYLRLIVPGTLISLAHGTFYIQFPIN
jgi:hypothetical protein